MAKENSEEKKNKNAKGKSKGKEKTKKKLSELTNYELYELDQIWNQNKPGSKEKRAKKLSKYEGHGGQDAREADLVMECYERFLMYCHTGAISFDQKKEHIKKAVAIYDRKEDLWTGFEKTPTIEILRDMLCSIADLIGGMGGINSRSITKQTDSQRLASAGMDCIERGIAELKKRDPKELDDGSDT